MVLWEKTATPQTRDLGPENHTMTTRPLGTTGIDIAPLALGGNVFGWTADETTSSKVLDAFVAAGFNLIDTADIYSNWVPGHTGGESETIIGKWLRKSGYRSKVVIATKIGLEMGPGQKGLPREYIHRAVERSLNRLQVKRSTSTSRTRMTRRRRSRRRLRRSRN